MEKLVRDGLVKNIGVCNFTTKKMEKRLGFAQIMPLVFHDPRQVLNKLTLPRGTSLILKSMKAKRIHENPHVFGWELIRDDFQILSSISEQLVMQNGLALLKTP
ncbi:hypothetical protein HPP92_017382 [Vanilla planifolia]|uniref:Uncharacterized protein n=1 Tax=Vanilla planifolia TaxID=51239 RepID=A0A835ULW4_VANPL|nr:hypothetical protein HPP92_017382 [Vanilla planifolia]